MSFILWWINRKWGSSYSLLLNSEETLLWKTELWLCQETPAAGRRTRAGGMGRHFSMFPKLIKVFWNRVIHQLAMWGDSLQVRKEEEHLPLNQGSRSPALLWKYTTKRYDSSSFLIGYRACTLTCKPFIYCHSSLLQNLHHCIKVFTVIYWLKK